MPLDLENEEVDLRIEDGYRLRVGNILTINLKTGDMLIEKQFSNPARVFWTEVKKCIRAELSDITIQNRQKLEAEKSPKLAEAVNALQAQVADLKTQRDIYKEEFEATKKKADAYKKRLDVDRFNGIDI